ncbi:MAG TPA: tRNA preQ1(34) S-adenosylmethionine ribosyltransferase-isomerase QueA [Candidatus Acidoferrales bacterium]|jgi:S-adenosylmethionine:tRNA ribosyltransferase-isomerase|nr:tRNA preQ1(34) S-adenosylmethionine ribosyltransferase-isomerase QueA [Candidatus Acidoferrales bacterium]
MKVSDLNYELPRELIAQHPLPERDASRLLLVERSRKDWEDHRFRQLPELLHGDELLVVNNARVLPARLLGRRVGVRAEPSGRHSRARHSFLKSQIEVLLTRRLSDTVWEALVRPGRKMRSGERVLFGEADLEAEVIGRGEFGVRRLRFACTGDVSQTIERVGHVPLPPYIDRPDEPADRERYQTIFASHDGAVAAPTAGLHFTPQILERLRQRGIELCEITLQVGLGTFQPIRTENLQDYHMLSEEYEIPEAVAARIGQARSEGRAVLAVGTTVVRALEDAALKASALRSGSGLAPGKAAAEIFIHPGYEFRVVDQVLTNFHLPKSSLLALVAAFAGRQLILRAYRHAIEQSYRFYSYGDCMLIR